MEEHDNLLTRRMSPVISLRPEDTALDAARAMREHGIGCVVVAESARPVGLVTDRDLVTRIVGARRVAGDVRLEEVMSRPLVTIDLDSSLSEVARVIRSRRIRRLPVVDSLGNLAGIFTSDDLMVLIGDQIRGLSEGIRKGFRQEGRTPRVSAFGKE